MSIDKLRVADRFSTDKVRAGYPPQPNCLNSGSLSQLLAVAWSPKNLTALQFTKSVSCQ